MAGKNTKYKFAGVNLEPYQKEAIKKLAKKNATSISFLFRQLIDGLLLNRPVLLNVMKPLTKDELPKELQKRKYE